MTPHSRQPRPAEATIRQVLQAHHPASQDLYLAIHGLILQVLPDASHTIDLVHGDMLYGTYQYGHGGLGTLELRMDREATLLVVTRGAHLPDPAGILRGARGDRRYVRLHSQADLDASRQAIRALLLAATERRPAPPSTSGVTRQAAMIIIAAAVMTVALNGAIALSRMTLPAYSPVPVSGRTPTPAPAETATARPLPTAPPFLGSGDPDGGPLTTALSQEELLALGHDVHIRICAFCHGQDARGQNGPYIIGKQAEDIQIQMINNAQMQWIQLTSTELQAIVAYLASLEDE